MNESQKINYYYYPLEFKRVNCVLIAGDIEILTPGFITILMFLMFNCMSCFTLCLYCVFCILAENTANYYHAACSV